MYCRTADQWKLYAIIDPLLEYIREAILLGFVTVAGSDRGKWRTYAVWSLAAAAFYEAHYTTKTEIKIPRDGFNVFMVCALAYDILSQVFLTLVFSYTIGFG